MIYPLKLLPPCKDYLWGGTKLKTDYGIQSSLNKIAESWELSCHKDGQSIIANGPCAGTSLETYIQQEGRHVLGTRGERFPYFPVLIKLIDAKDNLSVQVHPGNDYALRTEGEYGKTEMWYILDCEPDSSLIYGFQKEISKEEFQKRIEDNTLLEVTRQVNVHKGDVFFIEAGTLHAIGKGIVIAEIQQNSNTTYRVYDYGRLGSDGKPRALHIDKALDVTSLKPSLKEPVPQGILENKEGFSQLLLRSCEYFTVYRLDIASHACLDAGSESFHSLLCIDGKLLLHWEGESVSLQKGESIFLPSGFGGYHLAGEGCVLLTTV